MIGRQSSCGTTCKGRKVNTDDLSVFLAVGTVIEIAALVFHRVVFC